MLNIGVLVKCILDPVAIQWNYYDRKTNYLSYVLNKPDLHALQWACDYKEKYGAHIRVILAVQKAQDVPLDRLKKFPVDQITIIHTPDEVRQRDVVASLLAKELQEHPYDLILSGTESEDERTGMTPIVTAELLQIPCLTHIHAIEPGVDGKWTVHRKEGRGIVQSFQIQLPALIGVVRSIAQLSYIPRQAAMGNKNVIFKEAAIPHQHVPTYMRRKLTEPQPMIHYLDVPAEPLAQHRILSIAGLRGVSGEGNTERKRSSLSAEFAHFTARQLGKWLQEKG